MELVCENLSERAQERLFVKTNEHLVVQCLQFFEQLNKAPESLTNFSNLNLDFRNELNSNRLFVDIYQDYAALLPEGKANVNFKKDLSPNFSGPNKRRRDQYKKDFQDNFPNLEVRDIHDIFDHYDKSERKKDTKEPLILKEINNLVQARHFAVRLYEILFLSNL